MVIAPPPRSRCLARCAGVRDIRDIGQPGLAEVDSRTSRAETSSVTDETGSRATPTKQATSLGPTNVRPFFYRTLGECPVPGTILARRNEYTIRSLQRRNRGQRPGLAYICPLLGFPCVLVGVCSGGLGSAQHLRTFGGLSGPVPRVWNQGQPRKQRPLLKKLWDPEGIQPEAGG
jgi:hypothetical protein